MKRTGDYIIYLIFRFFLLLFGMLPFRIFYGIADLNFFLLFKIFRYRRKVVSGNLKRAFPHQTEEWRARTAHRFYRNLTDILMESLKGYTLSPARLLKRFRVGNIGQVREIEAKYPNIIVASAHCGNWEWGAMAAPLLTSYRTFGLYKPLSNVFIDRYIRRTRALHGMHLVPIAETSQMFRHMEEGQNAFFFIADQSPSNQRQAIWADFLGQPTAWLHGIEKYALRYNLPVFYFGIRRLNRGHYEVFVEEITRQPLQEEPGAITARYAAILENEVKNNPDDWLWSHRRWKMTATRETTRV